MPNRSRNRTTGRKFCSRFAYRSHHPSKQRLLSPAYNLRTKQNFEIVCRTGFNYSRATNSSTTTGTAFNNRFQHVSNKRKRLSHPLHVFSSMLFSSTTWPLRSTIFVMAIGVTFHTTISQYSVGRSHINRLNTMGQTTKSGCQVVIVQVKLRNQSGNTHALR